MLLHNSMWLASVIVLSVLVSTSRAVEPLPLAEMMISDRIQLSHTDTESPFLYIGAAIALHSQISEELAGYVKGNHIALPLQSADLVTLSHKAPLFKRALRAAEFARRVQFDSSAAKHLFELPIPMRGEAAVIFTDTMARMTVALLHTFKKCSPQPTDETRVLCVLSKLFRLDQHKLERYPFLVESVTRSAVFANNILTVHFTKYPPVHATTFATKRLRM